MDFINQKLNIEQYDIKMIKKMFCLASDTNIFYNEYTLMDVEEAKKAVYLDLLRKNNLENKEAVQTFVTEAANVLIGDMFSKNEIGSNTQMVGVKNVIKDPRKLNKNYFNETYRIINIDSTYRDNLWLNNYVYDSKTSTNMNIQLNDELDNVVTLELTNINIPFTFYNIDSNYGNNYFYIEISGNDSSLTKIEIDSGNYDKSTLVSNINTALTNASFNVTFTLNTLSNKVSVTNGGADNYNIIFYDHLDNNHNFSNNNVNDLSPETQAKVNNNLGWFMGFRGISQDNLTMEYVLNSGVTIESESLCYIPYTKYFVVVIDDMNKNQTNKGLVQISNEKEFIKRTQYFSENDNSLNCLNDSNCDNYVNDSDRKLTKKQIYSTLQINNYRTNFNNKNAKMDTTGINNVFGIIPFEHKSLVWGESMFTSDKNRFKRKYSGPVDINRMNIKLLDDKGNIMNLNGGEWSMTLISTHLYQY
tara:strand:- start:6 stop:1427 length:1422 start_codon:yes stop_codon:yes gene_type:complete